MKLTIVRYKARPERADENQKLSKAVLEELEARSPEGVAYKVFRLDDDTFIHLAALAEGASSIASLPSFEAFRAGGDERWEARPTVAGASLVGSYGRIA